MKVSERLRKDADDIWGKIIKHPFVTELYNGTLPIGKFRFYILQDYNYLTSSIKNFSIISSKADSIDSMREVIEILHLESVSEFKGYEEFLRKLGYRVEDAENIKPTPTNISYVNFLLSTSSLKSYAESITSVLPCFWSYAEIAEHHKDKLSKNENKLYVDWASVYLSEPYVNLVEKIKRLVDKAGETASYEMLKKTFITASKYEYMYWDAIYNMNAWPI
jgi:thiaminase/transcriptional activator TenA